MSHHPNGLARQISSAYFNGEFRISRPNAPVSSWNGLPEAYVANELRQIGASDPEVRYFLTFTSALDRARDSDALFRSSGKLFKHCKHFFDPNHVYQMSYDELLNTLRTFKVSQRHNPDSTAWRTIAQSLLNEAKSFPILNAINNGIGEANSLLNCVQYNKPMFPFLGGPKIGPMWVRMLVFPGRANISNLIQLPVSVDVQVRKVSEYLGVTNTANKLLSTEVRHEIQNAWYNDVLANGSIGPGILANTCCALDPALWFYGKWGCTNCEKKGYKVLIHPL